MEEVLGVAGMLPAMEGVGTDPAGMLFVIVSDERGFMWKGPFSREVSFPVGFGCGCLLMTLEGGGVCLLCSSICQDQVLNPTPFTLLSPSSFSRSPVNPWVNTRLRDSWLLHLQTSDA